MSWKLIENSFMFLYTISTNFGIIRYKLAMDVATPHSYLTSFVSDVAAYLC